MERKAFLGKVGDYFRSHPMVGILGPRQCGKTTLAREYVASLRSSTPERRRAIHYFDLEDPEHLNRLADPKLALEPLEGLIVIDEVQRAPELFPLLRVLVDRRPRRQRYLILGSASRALIRQSSETLAGRIAFLELPPFTAFEAGNLQRLWLRGGFPPAYLAKTNADSMVWRKAYVTALLERDLPALGIDFAAATMRRFWMMLAHRHGSLLNASELARSMDVSQPTVKRHLDILSGTFMVRLLQPWHANVHKRQVKSPKLYVRDAGLLHALLNLPDLESLRAHPGIGASWEGFALEQAIQMLGAESAECHFWATHTEAELDLLVVRGSRLRAFEFKYTSAPKPTRSMHSALKDLALDRITIVYPGNETYPLTPNIDVTNLAALAGNAA
ncbi:MAG: ATP-binding protein [Gammaproteobacteria bacterium]|nr:ATP-binding protein [Gammaproteobacteria bacterium]